MRYLCPLQEFPLLTFNTFYPHDKKHKKFRIAIGIHWRYVLFTGLRPWYQLSISPRIEGITGNQFGRIISDHCRHFHPVPYFWLSGRPYNQKNRIQTNNGPFILMFAICLRTFHTIGKLESFPLFLLASFISGSANAYLQAAVNPYITILGPIDSAAKRISIMGICNKLAWPIPPLFLAFLIGKEVTDITVADLFLPFYVIIAAFIALGIIAYMAPLPEVKAVGEDDSEEAAEACPYAAKKTSIWQFPHLLLGCLALFLYVGVETVSLGTLVDYATSLHLENAAMYAWIAPIGIVIGYICGIIFIPKYMSQATALKICSVLAIIGSVLVVLTPADISIYFISFMALGCSLMWPALWPLAMADLGKFTKSGSSLLIMAMAGGAVIPTLFGYLKDISDIQKAYWICLPCFLFILYYGVAGYKIRTK